MNTLSLLNDAKYFDEGNSKFAELRTLLDSKHAKEKLEAMKRLMAMVTIGRDVSSFFPDVVKNVVVESTEVKKLVYMYLIHYADQNQELALLSINSFQRDLVSPSQRVRGNALKAMSSIRIPVAIPLVILALKAAVKDASSYVRRAAAAAIPKVFAVDPDQHELLLELIQELLTNNEPLVLGSTIFAFNAVCPDRLDLLHPHFRKICHLLADFDEWGQIITLELLLRYGRTQFLAPPRGIGAPDDEEDALAASPDAPHHSSADAAASSSASAAESASKKPTAAAAKKSTKFYSDDEEDASGSDQSNSSRSGSDSDSDSAAARKKKRKSGGKKAATDTFSSLASFATPAASAPAKMAPGPLASPDLDRDLDEDHKLLLKQASQLLQSSNTGVIVAVSSLMWALAPREELAKVIKPLVRLSRNKRNMQYIVLTTIATMASSHPSFFRSYLKDFFVFAHEPRYIKLLKLDILSAITSEDSIGAVLKECAIYTLDPDKAFVTATVVAIGRVATRMPSIAARCIRGLMGLVQSGSHAEVVAQSIVVIRQLLQSNVANITAPLLHSLALLLDGNSIQSADARCALVWMVGEYRSHLPAYAPDVLRKLAKSFSTEADPVKVQILNLALKLFLSNPKQTSTLFKYVMDLAKYDTNIDLRDRARMFRTMFFKKKAGAADAGAATKEVGSEVKDHFKSILLLDKPAPKLLLPFAGRDRWILGTMSHTLDRKVPGYVELPPHPSVQPDPSVRKPKLAAALTLDDIKSKPSDRRSKGKSRGRRGSGSDSGSDSDRSGSSRSYSRSSRSASSDHSHGSEFSSFGSESEGSSGDDRGRRRRRGSGSDRSRSDSGSRSRSRSRSRSSSASRSGSGSDSDASRRRRKAKSSSRPARKRRSRSRSASGSRSRSRSRSPRRSRTPPASSASPVNGGGFLDLLDLKGLDLSSGALEDSTLDAGGFGALGEAHITFTHPAGSAGAGGADDLLSPFGASPQGAGAGSSGASGANKTQASASAAEADILARAFGPAPSKSVFK